jgi:hypothetical protein
MMGLVVYSAVPHNRCWVDNSAKLLCKLQLRLTEQHLTSD